MSVRRLSEPSSPPTSQEASSKPSTISTPKIVASFRYHCNVAQSIYDGPTICAKDQTKATELIEVCRQRRLKKATYITIYALTFIGSYQLYIRRYLSWVFTLSDIILKACVPGIPPIVIEVNPSGKTEKRIKSCGAMAIGLYFDGAIHDRNWFGEVYSKDPAFTYELALKK
ncbi:21454_t:CDS:2 [Rhizophagus irregularis]|nr:21454_t:CDS:2 [Rhizophagus irregularis]